VRVRPYAASPPPAGARPGRGARLLLAAALATLSVAGCAETEKGIPHPIDRLHFPTTLAADPDGRFLYVVSSNFDVRYRTGAVTAIDLDTWELLPETAIGIGHFGGEIAVHPVAGDGYRAVGYVTSRAGRSLQWFTISDGAAADGEGGAPIVDCGLDEGAAEDGEVRECQDDHTVTGAERKRLPRDDEGLDPEQIAAADDAGVDMSLGLDVYGVTVFPAHGGVSDYLLVTNPRNGELSVFHIQGGYPVDPDTPGQAAGDRLAAGDGPRSAPGEPVYLEDVFVVGGAFAVALTPEGDEAYATSRFANGVTPFEITEFPDPDGGDRRWPQVRTEGPVVIANSTLVGDFGRELVFDRSGARAYLAYRNPSSVVLLDTARDEAGRRSNRVLDLVDVGLQPTALALAATGPGGTDRLYVVCYGAEELWVLDPDTLNVEDVLDLPGGQFDLVVLPDADGRRRGYLTMFELDAVAVVDLDPTSPFFHQPIAYIRGVDDEGAHQ